MIRRTVADVTRLYGRNWWRLGSVVFMVALVVGVLLWLVARAAAALADHLRTTFVVHGHLRASGVNAFALAVAAVVVVVCVPVALAGVAAVVRITDDALAGRRPKILGSLAYGIRRIPRLFVGGAGALAGLVVLVVLAAPLCALGLLGLLLTGPVVLLARRWNWLAQHWPSARQLLWLAIPLAPAARWLAHTVLLVPAATLDVRPRLSSLRRADSPLRGRGPLVIGMVSASVAVVFLLEIGLTWIAFLIGSTDGRLIGQAVSQFVLLGLPIAVLTILYRLNQAAPPGAALPSSLTDPYGRGVDPLGPGFLAGATPALMTPGRLRHRRVALGMPIVLLASFIGLAVPGGTAGAGGDGEGGGSTPGGSITLTVNSAADDPATAPAEAPNAPQGRARAPCAPPWTKRRPFPGAGWTGRSS